jgi:hypothetical protein
MTAQNIISQARQRLGDIKEQRWTNERLLSLVSQGQVDICLESGYLRNEVLIPLVNGQNIYTLPSDCYTIKRVEYDGKLLPLYTRDDQDIPKAVTTDYVAYKSNLDMNKLEIQPDVTDVETFRFVKGVAVEDDLFTVTPIFGVVVKTSSPNIDVEPSLGAVTGVTLDYTQIPDNIDSSVLSEGYGEVFGDNKNDIDFEFPKGNYGVTTAMEYIASKDSFGFTTAVKGHTVSGNYGLVADVARVKDCFRVYYVAIPKKLHSLGSQLVLPELWEDILIRYVVGTALQDDNDANNITRGEVELQKYQVKLNKIRDLSSKNFSSSTSVKNETTYRRV